MSSLARLSCHKRQRRSTDVHRPSNLSESILCHILSFLPTKDAVATSLVSKRWKFLWTNIHGLIFSDYDVSTSWLNDLKYRKIQFAHFVNKVLLSLNHQTIHKFSLGIKTSCEVYDVTTWIATAVARNVRVLEFCLRYHSFSDPHIKLPCSLFTCKSLEVLALEGMMNLNVPSLVCLPKLKTLILKNVIFQCDESFRNHLPCSLLTCKTLEFLNLDGVMSLNVPTLVCLPNLKTMRLNNVIFQCDESFRNLVSGCSSLQTLYVGRHVYDNVVTFTISSPTLTNLTFHFYEHAIDIEQHGYKLEINASALPYFYLRDCLSRNFSVESLCSLDKADIDLYFGGPMNDYEHYSKAVIKLLRGVCNVKELYLRRNAFEFFGNTKDEHVTCWSKPDKVPICFVSCFERMSILRVKGLEDELVMIAYILKKAKVLRTMTIQAAFHLDDEAKFQLLQKISKFPQRSKKCEIICS